jgi:hypothetical protein
MASAVTEPQDKPNPVPEATASKAIPKEAKEEPIKPNEKSGVFTVSALKYWQEGDEPDLTNPGPQSASYLSYTVLMILTVLGGFFGLDHLYLRSPFSFLAKFGVNIMCFGVWWIWDMCQVFFNEPVVRVYGLDIPVFGSKGIASGVLASDEPSEKHMTFFIYAVALCFGGMFGLDSFLVGDNRFGLFRLLATLSVIFSPLSGIIWAVGLYFFFFKTKMLVGFFPDYFAGNGGLSIFGMLNKYLKPIGDIASAYTATLKVFDDIIKAFQGVAGVIPGRLYGAVTQSGLEAAKEAVKSPEPPVPTADAPVKTVNLLPETPHPTPVNDPSAPGAPEPNTPQAGGGEDIKLLPYTLLGTVLLLFTSGIYKNFSKKNVAKDDPPPQPRTV